VPKIDNEIVIDRSPDQVWAVLGDLSAVTRWVPGVASARMEGLRRICTMEDGSEIHEEISDLDGHSFRYEQTVHPLGFERSEGTLSIEPHGGGARWPGTRRSSSPTPDRRRSSCRCWNRATRGRSSG
jgi:uncharacterized protein YndB with AHSA1/START domain